MPRRCPRGMLACVWLGRVVLFDELVRETAAQDFLRLKIWHEVGQFEQEIGSPSAASAFMGVVARAEVMDRHPLSYLVRVSEEVPPTYLAYSWTQCHLGQGVDFARILAGCS